MGIRIDDEATLRVVRAKNRTIRARTETAAARILILRGAEMPDPGAGMVRPRAKKKRRSDRAEGRAGKPPRHGGLAADGPLLGRVVDTEA